MGFWTDRERHTAFHEAEDFAYPPSGGPGKAWLLGICLPIVPIGYGVRCLFNGHARFFGQRGSFLDLSGSGARALAIAYIALGVFIHAHWFWGLHPKLEPFSEILKILAAIVFLGGFGYTIYKIIA